MEYGRLFAPPDLASILPLYGPELRWLDAVVASYQWPQWHQQYLASGATGDGLLSTDPGFFIKLVRLDAGRADAVAQAQLEIVAKALVYDGGLESWALYQTSINIAR